MAVTDDESFVADSHAFPSRIWLQLNTVPVFTEISTWRGSTGFERIDND